ncbi:ClpXP protease specificity-enhancing factor [Porticoccaceae bacterium]|nr:ClpXP protease specificity-enhancing factor [Porticoccaceae bacterium]MDG2116983.1 ClpXP protease specificity-enhancing factor [Porticoccaceae bacterium]
MKMRSNRPYLLRAFYDWIVDNDCTPYIVVNAHYPGVEVPQDFVTDGQIVLNIAPRAVSSFEMNNDHLQLSTRFSGMPIDIYLPVGAVMGIYTQENGQGMVFEPEDPEDEPPEPPKGPQAISADRQKKSKKSSTKPSKGKAKPSLRVVK